MGRRVGATLSYFPFMYLPVAATLRRLDPAVEESARALGSDSAGVFFRVVLPQLRLAILGGGLLIGVHLLAEFGAFAMLRFDTFTVAIFQQFQVTFDGAAGSMLAGVLVLLCLVLLVAEALARGRARFARIGSGVPRAATPIRLGRNTLPAQVGLAALTVFALGVPVWTILRWLWIGGADVWALDDIATALGQTIGLATVAAALTTVLAFPVAWVAVRSSGVLARVVEGANYVTSSLPGIVTALALVTVTIHLAPPALSERRADRVRVRAAVHAPRTGQRPSRARPGAAEPRRGVPVAGQLADSHLPAGHTATDRARSGCRRIAGIRRCGNGIDCNTAARTDRHQDAVDAVLVVLQRAGLRRRSPLRTRAGGARHPSDTRALPAVDEGGRAMTTILEVKGLAKSFHANTVLHDIDLDLQPGTTTAVVGSSGCGKTTLLRLIAGFETPDAGTITIDGRQVASPESAVAPHRRGVGYVAQDGALFPHLTVGQNIAYGLRGTARGEVRARVSELLETVSLDASYASRRPHQLSGGQQQRVALARALARHPVLMLLDEPFSALDTGLRASTRKAVAGLLTNAGVTTLLVTHDQEEAHVDRGPGGGHA